MWCNMLCTHTWTVTTWHTHFSHPLEIYTGGLKQLPNMDTHTHTHRLIERLMNDAFLHRGQYYSKTLSFSTTHSPVHLSLSPFTFFLTKPSSCLPQTTFTVLSRILCLFPSPPFQSFSSWQDLPWTLSLSSFPPIPLPCPLLVTYTSRFCPSIYDLFLFCCFSNICTFFHSSLIWLFHGYFQGVFAHFCCPFVVLFLWSQSLSLSFICTWYVHVHILSKQNSH